MTRGEKGGDPARRPQEAERATSFIGLDGYWVLDFPDTGLGERVPALREAIEAKIREVGATLVLTHTDVDVHGDHRAVHAATREAARAVPTVLCYEDVSTSKEFVPNYFVDITDYIEPHLKAVAFHRSQDHRTYMDPQVVRGRAAHRGMQVGTSFAMAFRTLNLVR
jgi:LmbE family N-acetylglucosaminyl deacetylase